MTNNYIGIIGYGEVGRIFAAGLKGQRGITSVTTYDRKLENSGTELELLKTAARAGIDIAPNLGALCDAATLIISAVTASNTLAVAQEAARHIRPGTLFLDLNSASPGTKRQAAQAIEEAGGHYVEAGVMSSVPPHGIKVPMLLGGARAGELAPALRAWGMDATIVAVDIGVASAIKMCRSIMIKGMETLVIESYSTALYYGVADKVLPTLAETFPQIDWSAQGTYFFSRVVQHGKRRAEEMRESAATVREAGFAPLMAVGIAEKLDWVATLASDGLFDKVPKNASWQEYAERLLFAGKEEMTGELTAPHPVLNATAD
ncbi:DUF1932 domain-containing protein [Glaciimonas sp. Gout2]|uniref:NAD(P)-dependent oxidoreductase n=2 Tax=Bacteria TaxID=2 RepID=UPI002AB4844F|nr:MULTISPECIES: DUF1932 domain-containing protein [Oxalobacteraceae]MDY7578829.1 DUF1932 domain-containing protein [Herbaspirillum sp. RTI4]MEA9982683.1 DUF1932 domain-containing protein [Herbaspirillum sp. RTI4]MEB0013081.1 DUF1932 domain-containing protein [Glaciimonas sp. Cout2]MEB0082036.1 DUF1932 domain-containing protein [Glaciimonas sp. Gout2]